MVLMESVSHQFDEYKNDGTIHGIGPTLSKKNDGTISKLTGILSTAGLRMLACMIVLINHDLVIWL